MNIRYLITRVAVVSTMLLAADARAWDYSYEYIQYYSTLPGPTCPGTQPGNICGGYNDICNTKADATGFGNVLQAAGGVADRIYPNNSVYNTDLMERSWRAAGADDSFTDTVNGTIYYISAHGSCGNRIDASKYCNTDADCGNSNQRCWTANNAHRCANSLASGDVATCSSFDNATASAAGAHGVLINQDMCFGETSGWKGCGTNGNLNYAAFSTSCPFQMGWLTESGWNLFGGLHIVMGTSPYASPWPSTTTGDIGDTATLGTHFATRLKNVSTVASSWVYAFMMDEPSTLLAPACTIAMACAATQNGAVGRINQEAMTDGLWFDESAPPTWCQWLTWCHF